MKKIVVVVFALLAVSCGDSDDNNGFPDNNDSPSNSGGDCTTVLRQNITSPTSLVNGSAYCDYQLERTVYVRSMLTIEPGVVIRAKADVRLILDGGEISAIGAPDERITFEGLAPVQGYWRGIHVQGGRGLTMDYVDIKDAGQVCTRLFCPDVGVYVENTVLSFTNSSVSNSYVHGMSISDGTAVRAFANNRFYGNSLNGLNVEIELVPTLDTASDYGGVDEPNGVSGVGVISGAQERGEVFVWKDINAPYFISGYLNVEGGIMRLDPGVELVFDAEAWMTVTGNGVFQALGTAARPIVIRGRQARPGYWDGIRIYDTSFSSSKLQHTTISHTGNTEGLLSAYAAVRLDEADITMGHTTFSDNARWGIYCTEPDYVTRASVIVNEGGNQFFNNGSGTLVNCSIQ